jgi:hypothetical protein
LRISLEFEISFRKEGKEGGEGIGKGNEIYFIIQVL